MIPCILVILTALYYLMRETNWGRIRLLTGHDIPSNLWLLLWIKDLYATRDEIRDMRDKLEIDNPLVSWCWLKLHWNDMDNYQQTIEIDAYGIRSKLTVKKPETISKVMRALKPSRKERRLALV